MAAEEGASAWSRSRIASWIREGRVCVEGRQVCKPSAVVLEGQRIELDVPPPPPIDLIPEDLQFQVLYVDDHLVVVDKPAGLVVHPGAGHSSGTLVNGLLARVSLSPIGLPLRPGIVHRIDRGTSGILTVARSEQAHLGLVKLFAAHDLDRRYRALVWDHRLPDSGTAKTPYGRHPTDRVKFTGRLKLTEAEGRIAVTHWHVMQRCSPFALVEFRLETGRTHQIRVHMSELGSPLVGDPLYGQKRRMEGPLRPLGFELGLERQALHAGYLSFRHPVTGDLLRFSSPWPEDLMKAYRAVGFSPFQDWPAACAELAEPQIA